MLEFGSTFWVTCLASADRAPVRKSKVHTCICTTSRRYNYTSLTPEQHGRVGRLKVKASARQECRLPT